MLAASLDAKITCIDIAPNMIKNAIKCFEKHGLSGEFICGDVMQHSLLEHYDVVAANFFLNIFPEATMKRVLTHLVSMVKPGGKLLIADFATPRGNKFLKFFHVMNYWVAILFYWSMQLEPLHPIYYYPRYFSELGLELIDTKYFRVFKWGPYAYQSITACRSSHAKS